MAEPTLPSAPVDRPSGRGLAAAASVVVAGLVAVLYAQVHRFGFVSFDDPYYIQRNPWVQGGLTWEGVTRAFTGVRMNNWHPLTWLSHMLDVELFGPEPGPAHVVNAVLHGLNAVLVVWVLRALTGATARAAAVALLFAVHPLRAESVAWATERKDLLAALFFLLTLGAWARYLRRPDARRYALVAVSFALGLLCKSTIITLPAVLLLLDVWPLRRIDLPVLRAEPTDDPRGLAPPRPLRVVLLEKVPLLLLSAGSASMTVWAAGDRVTSSTDIPFANKLATPAIGWTLYLRKTFLPDDLACFYPLPQGFADRVLDDWTTRGAWLWAALVAVTLAVLVASFARRKAWLFTGWAWFLGMLVPVIGFMQVGSQLLADRFSYLPHLGLGVALVWTATDLLGTRRGGRVVLGGALVGAVVALSLVTHEQVGTWRNSYLLFKRAVDVTDDNPLARHHLGLALERRDDVEGARAEFRRALAIQPSYAPAAEALGESLASTGELDEAETLFRGAAAADPSSFEARYRLGALLAADGRPAEALPPLREAVALRPSSPECAALLGRLEAEHGDPAEAQRLLRRALDLRPDDRDTRALLQDLRRRRRDG